MTASREKAVATLLTALRESPNDEPPTNQDTFDLSHLLAELRQPTSELQKLVSSSKALRPLKRVRCIESIQYLPHVDGKVTIAQLVKHLDKHQPSVSVTSPSRRRELLYNARRSPGQDFFFEKLLVPKKERQGVEIAPVPWTSSPPKASQGDEESSVEKGVRDRDPVESKKRWEEWKRRKDAMAKAAREVEKAQVEEKERCCARKELTFEKWMKEKAKQRKESEQRQRKMIEERHLREREYQQEKKQKLKQLRGNILQQKLLQRKLHRKNQIKARLLPAKAKAEGSKQRGIPYLQKLAKTPAVGKMPKPKQRVVMILKRIKTKVDYKSFASMLKELGLISHPELVNRMHAILRAQGLELLREDIQTLALALPRTEKRTLDFSSLRKLWRMCKDNKESVIQPEIYVRHEIGSDWPELVRCASSSELQAETSSEAELEKAFKAMLHTTLGAEPSDLLFQSLQRCCRNYCNATNKPWSVQGLAMHISKAAEDPGCGGEGLRASLFNFFDTLNTSGTVGMQELVKALKALSRGESKHLARQVEGTVWLDLMTHPSTLRDLGISSQEDFTRSGFVEFWESRHRRNIHDPALAGEKNTSKSLAPAAPSATEGMKARKVRSKAEGKSDVFTLEQAWGELKAIERKDLQIYGGQDRVPSKRGMAILGCLCLLLRRPCTLNTISELFDDWDKVLTTLDSLKLSDFTFLTQEDRDKITHSVSHENLETFIRQNEMAFFGNILRCIRIIDKLLPTALQDVLGKLSADAVQSFTASGIRRTSKLLSGSVGQEGASQVPNIA